MNNNINWTKIVIFDNIPGLQSFHFWRVKEMKLEELLFDIIQMEDKKSLRAFILYLNTSPEIILYKMMEFFHKFKMNTFRTRFLKMRNYVIFLDKLETLNDNLIIDKKSFFANQDYFCGPLDEEDKLPISYNSSCKFKMNK